MTSLADPPVLRTFPPSLGRKPHRAHGLGAPPALRAAECIARCRAWILQLAGGVTASSCRLRHRGQRRKRAWLRHSARRHRLKDLPLRLLDAGHDPKTNPPVGLTPAASPGCSAAVGSTPSILPSDAPATLRCATTYPPLKSAASRRGAGRARHARPRRAPPPDLSGAESLTVLAHRCPPCLHETHRPPEWRDAGGERRAPRPFGCACGSPSDGADSRSSLMA